MKKRNDDKRIEHLNCVHDLQRFVDEEYDVLMVKCNSVLDYIHQPDSGMSDRLITQLSYAVSHIKLAASLLKDNDKRNAYNNLKISEEILTKYE